MSDYDDASDSGKRPAPSPTHSISSASKRLKTRSSPTSGADKSSRGLRHFSMMVCQKVQQMGTTTYNEVADELVKNVVTERQKEGTKFDEKNIRRRVYDALNVLMAMDIISKDKKEITWKGLPTAESQDLEALRLEIEHQKATIRKKHDAMKELLVQQVCFRNLIWHNHHRRQRGADQEKIPLPFIVVNTNNASVIQCDMSRDRTDVMFDFSMPFEINDDNTILKKMGLEKTSMSVLQEMLPGELLRFFETHRLLDAVLQGGAHVHRSTSAQHRRVEDFHSSQMNHPQHSYPHHSQPLPHTGYHHRSHQHPSRASSYPPHYGGYDHLGPDL